MAKANVEIEALVKIRKYLNKLRRISNKGLSDSEHTLSYIEGDIKRSYQQAQAKIAVIEAEIERLEREADAEEEEYNRKLREAEEAKANGDTSYTLPYRSPDEKREICLKKRRQLDELRQEVENLRALKKQYNVDRDAFLCEFKKIASTTGGDNGDISNLLTKSIETLDNYVHTNFSAGDRLVYDNYSTQNQPQNLSNISQEVQEDTVI